MKAYGRAETGIFITHTPIAFEVASQYEVTAMTEAAREGLVQDNKKTGFRA